MASEYLRKSVADRRTGANLIGINVDTSNMRDLTPEFEMAFNQLEAFAKQTDNLKIESEKRKIALEIAQSRVDFKEKYLSDPTVYNSQEKWNEVSKLYEEERKKAKKRISESRYLSADEKTLYGEDVDLDFKKDWLDPLNKRNGAVIQERISAAMSNIDMITSIASMGNIYDNGVIEKAIKDIKTEYKDLISLGVQTESDMNFTLAQKIPMIEGSLFLKKLDQDIIKNPNYATAKEKMAEVDKIIDTFKNPERLEQISKQYGFEDNAKKYFELKTAEVYGSLRKDVERNLYNLEQSRKRLENQQREKTANEKNVRLAVNNNDTYKLTKFKTGLDYSFKNMLDDEKNIETLYGEENNIKSFGNIDNWQIAKVLNKEAMDIIKNKKAVLDDTNSDTYSNSISAIYEFANEYSGGDNSKKNMIIKDAARQLGLDINIVLNYEKNPEYLTIGKMLRKGKNIELGIDVIDGDLEQGIKNIFNWRTEDKYLELFNELGGDERAYEVLNQYISGFVASEAAEYKRTVEYMPLSSFQAVLKDKDMFEKLKKNLYIVKDLAITPIKYDYAQVKGENYGVEELFFEKEPAIEVMGTEEDYYSFGG